MATEQQNPGLLNIRRWAAADVSVLGAVAAAHLLLIERARVGPNDAAAHILARAARSANAQEFDARLTRL